MLFDLIAVRFLDGLMDLSFADASSFDLVYFLHLC